jgi:hypothetical protein
MRSLVRAIMPGCFRVGRTNLGRCVEAVLLPFLAGEEDGGDAAGAPIFAKGALTRGIVATGALTGEVVPTGALTGGKVAVGAFTDPVVAFGALTGGIEATAAFGIEGVAGCCAFGL